MLLCPQERCPGVALLALVLWAGCSPDKPSPFESTLPESSASDAPREADTPSAIDATLDPEEVNVLPSGQAPDASSGAGSSSSGHSELDCASATTLGGLILCIREGMPRAGSEGFVVPTAAERLDFRAVVGEMLRGHCDFALPPSLAGAMRLRSFADEDNGKTYCVLREAQDADGDGRVDRGWGTFIVDPTATRELVHEAPHPLADTETDLQAVEVFKGTDSRAFLLCGAHRAANAAASGCDARYEEADCAHAIANMFHPAILEIDAFYGARAHTQIQWHGMAATTCASVGAHLSQGVAEAPLPGVSALALQSSVVKKNPGWVVSVPGNGGCELDATDNIGGRFLNGVPPASLCDADAGSPTGKFLHVEQHLPLRVASAWIAPLAETFPIVAPLPPSALVATPGKASVTLSWSPVNGASGYDVLRASASGGPWTEVETAIVTIGYLDAPVKKGTTYHYAIRARNPLGLSAPSTPVSVKVE